MYWRNLFPARQASILRLLCFLPAFLLFPGATHPVSWEISLSPRPV